MNALDLKKLRPDALMILEDIKKVLPHRYPFLLVDRVVSMEAGVRCRAIKNVTANEEYFNGHFPHMSIMPGVVIIEALAQVCALLAISSEPDPDSKFMLFAGIDKTKFKRPVIPGDQLILDVEFLRRKMNFAVYRAQARVDGKITTEGELNMAFLKNAP